MHSSASSVRAKSALLAVRILHTAIWAFFATCIIAAPLLAYLGLVRWAILLLGLVCIEVLVLLFNSWNCPLTAIAGRYTSDRSPNFDICLPVWLARFNKHIFGFLFVVGGLYTLFQWFSVGGAF